MKRIHWREILIVGLPLGIIGLGLVAIRVRENRWPDRPQIVKCEVRPATPLEISQGAHFGVTVKGVAPSEPFPCAGIRYSDDSKSSASVVHIDCYNTNSIGHKATNFLQRDYFEDVETYGLRWRDVKSRKGLLKAQVKMASSCGGYEVPESRQVVLDPTSIALPDVNAARKANFRVSKAVLSYDMKNGIPDLKRDVTLRLNIENASNEARDLIPKSKCIGEWIYDDGGEHSIPADTGSWGGNSQLDSKWSLTRVDISLDCRNLKTSLRPNTTIYGVISIGGGWPQEITLQGPWKFLPRSSYSAYKEFELAFSTRLVDIKSDSTP